MVVVWGLTKSNRKNKKYMAAIVDDNGNIYKNVHFGDTRYQQYKDKTPLGLYSHLDHNDENRRRLYHLRHKNDTKPAGILSKAYLW